MADGIDGLLGGLSTVSLAGLAVAFFLAGKQPMMVYCLSLIAAIIPFMLLNLGFPFGKRLKIFMGDAGSTLMGFTIIWLAMIASQGDDRVIAPANILWLLALPLMDMVSVTTGRIKNKKSPFKPDRTHFHHLLIDSGLSAHKTLVIILVLAITYTSIGLIIETTKISELLSLTLFVILFALHCCIRVCFYNAAGSHRLISSSINTVSYIRLSETKQEG